MSKLGEMTRGKILSLDGNVIMFIQPASDLRFKIKIIHESER
jgi:hypothetical protein